MTCKAWINGYSGRMGEELQRLMAKSPQEWSLLGGTSLDLLFDRTRGDQAADWLELPHYLERTDLLIDFSAAAGNQQLFKALTPKSLQDKAILIGTTGLSSEQKEQWVDFSRKQGIRLLIAPNTSLGVLLTLKVSQLIGGVLKPLGFDIEILESHHRSKLDAPSGTAKFLADGLTNSLKMESIYARTGQRQANEIGVASLRGGSVFGEHDVRFLGDNEEICISHRALNRSLFAEGALLLGRWLLQQTPGSYRLEDISIEDMVLLLQKK